MASNFATIRQTKVKSADQHNALNAHNNRAISGSNINKTKTHSNITLTPTQYNNFDDFIASKKTAIREANAKRKNGEKKARFPREVLNKKTNKKELPALSQEFIFSHSHKALSEEESIEYLKRADLFIKKWFPSCEVLSSIIHLDEKTPHIHIHISYFDENENRFIQKTLSQKGKTDINEIRKAFQKEVADEFELLKQDGSVVSKEDHQAKASTEIAELKEQIAKEATRELSKQEILNATLKTEQGEFTVGEIINKQSKIIGTLKARETALNHKLKTLPSQDTLEELKTLKSNFNALKHKYNDLEKQVDTLKEKIKVYRERFKMFMSKLKGKYQKTGKKKIEPIVLPDRKSTVLGKQSSGIRIK